MYTLTDAEQCSLVREAQEEERQMSLQDYTISKELERLKVPFYALIMAAMRQADSNNLARLQDNWPNTWKELQDRYYRPGGVVEGEFGYKTTQEIASQVACQHDPSNTSGELISWCHRCGKILRA